LPHLLATLLARDGQQLLPYLRDSDPRTNLLLGVLSPIRNRKNARVRAFIEFVFCEYHGVPLDIAIPRGGDFKKDGKGIAKIQPGNRAIQGAAEKGITLGRRDHPCSFLEPL
jgi:hypothetical protein